MTCSVDADATFVCVTLVVVNFTLINQRTKPNAIKIKFQCNRSWVMIIVLGISKLWTSDARKKAPITKPFKSLMLDYEQYCARFKIKCLSDVLHE